MPIYDYACRKCGETFEELVRSDTLVSCPGCGSRAVERRLSVPAPPVTAGKAADFGRLGPPPGDGCCGGACHGPGH